MGKAAKSVKLTTYFHKMKSRICLTVPALPHTPPLQAQSPDTIDANVLSNLETFKEHKKG
jgi:hypothetical protein